MKRIAFDLDGVIATLVKNTLDDNNDPVKRYRRCQPISRMIEIVNSLYNSGHYIIIYTARGMSTYEGNIQEVYNNLYMLTKTQLNEWGVKYQELIMGKAHYDVLIDDKAFNSSTIEDSSYIERLLK
jgi:histidinol phosphatase-like enzyme